MRRIKRILLIWLVLGYGMFTNIPTVHAQEGSRMRIVKLLPAAYFNQWLEPSGGNFPSAGWKMCGAASAVIALSVYNKPIVKSNGNDHNFKLYMYKDAAIDKKGTPCGANQGGAWTYTNTGCSMSYLGGIQKYLKFYSHNSTYTYAKSFDFVKKAIDKGHPVIFNMGDSTDGNFGHIATIVGYTSDNKVIVNDTYTNLQGLGRGWKSYNTGKLVKYDLFSTRFPIGYLLEVS